MIVHLPTLENATTSALSRSISLSALLNIPSTLTNFTRSSETKPSKYQEDSDSDYLNELADANTDVDEIDDSDCGSLEERHSYAGSIEIEDKIEIASSNKRKFEQEAQSKDSLPKKIKSVGDDERKIKRNKSRKSESKKNVSIL